MGIIQQWYYRFAAGFGGLRAGSGEAGNCRCYTDTGANFGQPSNSHRDSHHHSDPTFITYPDSIGNAGTANGYLVADRDASSGCHRLASANAFTYAGTVPPGSGAGQR